MRVSLLLKLTTVCLVLAFNVQAQQEWENITSKFSSWQIGQGLYAPSNSLNNLLVRNTTGEGIINAQKKLNARFAVLNLNWKEDLPFEVSFQLSNNKTDPYTYSLEQVYWGLAIELYKKDGSVIARSLWLSADEFESLVDGKIGRYSFSTTNEDWKKWMHWGKYIKEMKIKIICNNNSLSAGFEYYPANSNSEEIEYRLEELKYKYDNHSKLSFATESNIAGIKSISIMVGSGTEISVDNFTVKRANKYDMLNPIVSKGDEYMDKKMYTDAVIQYNNAISQGYKNAEVYVKRAWAHFMKDNNAFAIDDCNTALSYDSNYKTAYIVRGLCKLKKEDMSGIDDLRRGGDEGIALLKEIGLYDYYPSSSNNNSRQIDQSQQRIKQLPQNILKKDPNFKIK